MKRLAVATMALMGAAGCATSMSAADMRAALMAPCENKDDDAPWLLVDAWESGSTYRPATQFRDDGVMIYAYEGQTYDNGRWSIDGDQLHMDTNDHYADYDGTFDGKSGSGMMKNVADNKGTWTLERSCDG